MKRNQRRNSPEKLPFKVKKYPSFIATEPVTVTPMIGLDGINDGGVFDDMLIICEPQYYAVGERVPPAQTYMDGERVEKLCTFIDAVKTIKGK